MLLESLHRAQNQQLKKSILSSTGTLHLTKDMEDIISYFNELKVTVGEEEQ